MADFGQNILILVPHPDDEVVACAATAGRALKQGCTIHALYLTHGCIARDELWPWQKQSYRESIKRRHKESVEVARKMGIKPAYYTELPSRHVSRNTRFVLDKITSSIEHFHIDQLWVPAYEGGHSDHDIINGLVSTLCDRLSILEFSEYNLAEGKPHSNAFPAPNGTETLVRLTDEERKLKKALLALYVSEQRNLGYVGLDYETYRPLARYDYTKPPHDGQLWYTRFQWVPFRHPRIDFTKPAQVSESILRYTAPRT